MNSSAANPGVALTATLFQEESIPYFLWDEPMTIRELRKRLAGSDADRISSWGKSCGKPGIQTFGSSPRLRKSAGAGPSWKVISGDVGNSGVSCWNGGE